jgi:SAM-dependent methyltransferase
VAITDPWPSDAELAAAYGDWYRPGRARRFSFMGDALLHRTRGAQAARIDEIAPPGRILDVGAGDGTLVDALRARGREATGLERAPVREDLVDAAIGDLEPSWAAIVLWHSLEHLRDPGETIDHAARLLAPGGVVVIAVPDTSSLQARAFGDDWLHLDMPRHLVHFSSAALRAGLERRGLRVERTSGIRGGQVVVGWLDGLVGRLPGGLDLYQAIRQPAARSHRLTPLRRGLSIAAGVALLPVAAVLGALEVLARRSGTVYAEARRG